MSERGASKRDRFADRKYLLDDIPDDDPDLQSNQTYIDRVLDAYVDMRASTRSFIATRPSEARLLFLALLSDVIFFLARSMSMVVAPPAEVQASLPEFAEFCGWLEAERLDCQRKRCGYRRLE